MGIKPPKVSSHCDRLIEILVKYMVESLHSCLAVGAPTAAGARPGGGAGQLVTVTAMPGCRMPATQIGMLDGISLPLGTRFLL